MIRKVCLISIFTLFLVFSAMKSNCEQTDAALSKSLSLLATAVETDATKSIAVIKDKSSGKQGLFRVGDKILNYQIARIMRGKAMLLKEGKLYSLEFPLGGVKQPVTVVSANTRIIHRKALMEKIPDLNTAFQQVVVLPEIESGKVTGFKITKIKDKPLAKMAGIKEGDVVVSIEGEKLDSIPGILNMYSQLKDKEKVSLKIKRDKDTKELTYYLR